MLCPRLEAGPGVRPAAPRRQLEQATSRGGKHRNITECPKASCVGLKDGAYEVEHEGY